MISPSPFSVYASAFLNRSGNNQNLEASQASTSQPLFYSATAADDGDGDGDEDDGDPFRRLGGDDTPAARSSVLGDGSVPMLAGASAPQSTTHGASERGSVLFDSDSRGRLELSMGGGPGRDESSPYLSDNDLDRSRSRSGVAASSTRAPLVPAASTNLARSHGMSASNSLNNHAPNNEEDDGDLFPGDLDMDDLPMVDSELYDYDPAPRVRTDASTTQSTLNHALKQSRSGWRSHIAALSPSPSSKPQSQSQSHSGSGSQSRGAPPPQSSKQQTPLSPLHSHSSPYSDEYYHDSGSEEEEDYSDSHDPNVPPAYLTSQPTPAPPRTQRTPPTIAMNESLLPRDGVSRSLFYLPDPDRPVGRSKYNDAEWMTVWLTAVSLCAVGSVLIFFVTDNSTSPPPHDDKDPTKPVPYSTLTHTIPLLTMLTLASAGVSYGYLILFRFAVRPMLILTAISTPLFLFLSSAYAFSGSFFSSAKGVPPTWGETVGLRLFALVPLGFAYLSAKSFYQRYESLVQTASVVELSTSLLITHPSILLLSLALLIACFIASMPFLSLALHLLLVGYWSHPPSQHAWVWHVHNWAGTLCLLVMLVWLWSWAIARGTMRVVVAGVVGHWYFTANDPAYTLLSQQEATRAAFSRASGSSLGSICFGSLTLASVRLALLILRWARTLTTPPQLRPFITSLHPLSFVAPWIMRLERISGYALVCVGITGEGFWGAAGRARAIVAGSGQQLQQQQQDEDEDEDDEDIVNARRRRNGRRGGQARRVSDYTLISTLLSFSAASLAVFSAVGGYVFAAHTLAGAANAPLAALTCGVVTFLTVKFGLGLGEDAADAIYVCYNIDVQAGTRHRAEVFEVFEGRPAQGPIAV